MFKIHAARKSEESIWISKIPKKTVDGKDLPNNKDKIKATEFEWIASSKKLF